MNIFVEPNRKGVKYINSVTPTESMQVNSKFTVQLNLKLAWVQCINR